MRIKLTSKEIHWIITGLEMTCGIMEFQRGLKEETTKEKFIKKLIQRFGAENVDKEE